MLMLPPPELDPPAQLLGPFFLNFDAPKLRFLQVYYIIYVLQWLIESFKIKPTPRIYICFYYYSHFYTIFLIFSLDMVY